MIKIESSRNYTAPKNGASKAASLANSESDFHSDAGEAAEGSGDFARVLENLTSKKESSNNQAGETKPREKDVHAKQDQHDKSEHDSDAKEKPSDQTVNRDDAAGTAAAARTMNNANSISDVELSIPPARAIMHIADLERIVSSVRAQTFDGNSQVVITLKNSVCSGLQIKLTTDDKQRITAEFIAANEKVKAQIDARSGELADLLRQRGLKLTSLQSSVGSETSGGNDKRQNPSGAETLPVSSNNKSNNSSSVADQVSETAETANNYRV